MRTGWFQFLAVIGLVAVFAAVLPTHHHAAADTNPPADPSDAPVDGSKPDSHHGQDCPICQAAASLGSLPPPTSVLLIEPTPPFTHPINQARPASVRVFLPYDGRAPPAC